ncbi:MAG: NYN domain-containing protein [Candidatus Promineifilaceae bacterium]
MSQNIALFLDLDNLLIGAMEAGLPFDIELILEHLKSTTGGRIVLRRAYGDFRQSQQVPRQLAQAGFELQSVVRLNNTDKNLADIQMVADAIETLVNGYERFGTYVVITGDRDFMPLVQVLRRHNKIVVGLGVRHTTNSSLIALCDDYLYYDDIAGEHLATTDNQMRIWMSAAAGIAFQHQTRVQASLFRSYLQQVSNDAFAESTQGKQGFSKMLEQYPDIVHLERDGTTLYVSSLGAQIQDGGELYLKYRSALKRHGLRVVAAPIRLPILRDMLQLIHAAETPIRWHEAVELLFNSYEASGNPTSKSIINDILRVARRANIITLPDVEDQPLASMPITLLANGSRLLQDAIIKSDYAYLDELQKEYRDTFNLTEAALALYDSAEKASYLQYVLNSCQ